MDLDELLKNLTAAASKDLNHLPLIEVDMYIPDTSKEREKYRIGARRMISCYLFWLVTRDLLSEERNKILKDDIAKIKAKKVLPSFLLEKSFSDKLVISDITENAGGFSKDYLQSVSGGLGSDYHALFIEGTDLEFFDLDEKWKNYETIASLIDLRFNEFSNGIENWDKEYHNQDMNIFSKLICRYPQSDA